jgi:hypothetical protein
MKTPRIISRLLIFFAAPVFMGGCVITIGPFDEVAESGDGTTPVLPDPPGDEPVPLDEAQQARKDEVNRYIAEVIYQGAAITEAIQLPSGDIIDGLDRDTLPALPYALPQLPWTPDALQPPSGVELGVSDFEQYPELADLASMAAPFQRPDFSAYIMGDTDATSIEDYLDRYDEGGQPSGIKRLYAGLISSEPNRGAFGHMNQFRPEVEQGTFSLIEFAVFCPAQGEAQEVVGIAIQASRVRGRDGQPRLRIEYARPKDGQIKYSWDGKDGQFRVNPFRRHRPGQVVPVSVLAGKQVEHAIGIFQVPVTGDWWIFYKDDLLGYYPANLFTMLNGGACGSAWYGEVFNPNPGTTISTEMGSGQPGSAGALLAAYVRNPLYVGLDYWFGLEPQDDDLFTNSMRPEVQECYSRTMLKDGLFYLGGPGGNNPYCVWPSL